MTSASAPHSQFAAFALSHCGWILTYRYPIHTDYCTVAHTSTHTLKSTQDCSHLQSDSIVSRPQEFEIALYCNIYLSSSRYSSSFELCDLRALRASTSILLAFIFWFTIFYRCVLSFLPPGQETTKGRGRTKWHMPLKNKLAVSLTLNHRTRVLLVVGVRALHAMRPYHFSNIIAEFGTLSPSDTFARNLDIKLQSIVSCYPSAVCVIPGAVACFWFRFWCRCCLRVVYSTSTLFSSSHCNR